MAAGSRETPDFAQIIALRIACGGKRGCARADVKDDLFELLSHRLSQGEWNTRLDTHLEALESASAISKTPKGRIAITKDGKRSAVAYLGLSSLPTRNWNEILSVHLVAKTLDIRPGAQKRMKALSSSDGLRALVLCKYFDLKIKDIAPTAAQLRNALAVRALDEAFAEPLPGLENGSTRIPQKLSLFLASQNLQPPRTVTSTDKLVALLAAEAAGAVQPDPKSLRLALLREFVLPRAAGANGASNGVLKAAANGHENGKSAVPTVISHELDLAKFAVSVHELARAHAEGWAGNMRAYISHVWRTVQDRRPDWNMDEEAFKAKLTDAHRAGHLTLAIADLRDKSNIADVKESVTRYKNSEWHLIRVED